MSYLQITWHLYDSNENQIILAPSALTFVLEIHCIIYISQNIHYDFCWWYSFCKPTFSNTRLPFIKRKKHIHAFFPNYSISTNVYEADDHLKKVYQYQLIQFPESKVHGANMGPTWVLLAPAQISIWLHVASLRQYVGRGIPNHRWNILVMSRYCMYRHKLISLKSCRIIWL